MNKKVIHSVPNSKYGLIFVKVRAKHGRFLAKMRALYGQYSSFCDFLHLQSKPFNHCDQKWVPEGSQFFMKHAQNGDPNPE